MPNVEQPSSYEQQRREAEALPPEVKRLNAERLQRELQLQMMLMDRMGVSGEDSERIAWIQTNGARVRDLLEHDAGIREHMAVGDIAAAAAAMVEKLQH